MPTKHFTSIIAARRRQDYVPGQPAVYGQIITDACISLAQTEPLLEQFATA